MFVILRWIGLGCLVATGILAEPAHQSAAIPRGPAIPAAPSNDFVGPPGALSMIIEPGTAAEVDTGRRIYLDGIGANGQPVVGVRFGGVETRGTAAACVTCHRRSGLGAVEGNDQVPPVAGRIMLSDDPRALVSMNARNFKSFNLRHKPYDLTALGAALRSGTHVDGRELGPIMPRYELSDTEVKAIAAYVRTLSIEWSPGVTRDIIRFATVITPEVSPARRKAFIDTLRGAVDQKNGNVVAHGQRTMSAAEMILQTERRWVLDVWELQGPPESWSQQLDERLAAQPVFALVSGLGDGTWAPVHDFCERQKVPCWFPSVDMPPEHAGTDFFSVYFSRGVELEADVLQQHLLAGNTKPRRVVQIHAGDEAGRGAAERLRRGLADGKNRVKVEERVIATTEPTSLKHAFAKIGKGDVVMLWLQPETLSKLEATPVPSGDVYLSGYMANGEQAPLSADWRQRARMVYPYQLPDRRATGLMYFHAWLGIRKLPVTDELMQSEVYFAMTYLADTLMDMLDNLHRDYLIERAENMLSLRESAKAEDEAREMSIAKHHLQDGTQSAIARLSRPEIKKIPRPIPGKAEHVMVKRESTTAYPRLGLGQKQRFASKGAYIVRFAEGQGTGLVAETDWIVP